jgi:PKD repeat protein
MQKTANQIKSEFELLASGHYQIHSFLYAQEFEQQAYENLIYPLMLVYPLGGSLSGTSYTRNYRVVIADRVLKSEGNELEVESDTQLIALDTLAYWMKLGTNERFSITSSNTITPFWEKWGDEVTGHFVDIGIEEFYDFNSCAIPLSSAIPSPTNPCKDARILINSVIYGNAPSDSNFNVVVKNQSGALVGSLIGGEWIVNTGAGCLDSTYTITNSTGTTLYTGTIPSGGSLTQAISNSTLNVNNSAGTLISSRSILAQGTSSYNVADSVAVIKDSAGTTLKSENILATASENITINDSVAVIKDSVGATLKTENILSEATENITINNSIVNVRKSDNVLINAVSVKAENTENYLVADSTITNAAVSPTYSQLVKATEGLILPTQSIQNNGVASGFIPSVGTINVTTNSAPTSFTITGRTIDIVVPTGSTPMNVDFSADKLIASQGETITFTDLTDNSPTDWGWFFGTEGISLLQNPTFEFREIGQKNIKLFGANVTSGGFKLKSNYIEIKAILDLYTNADLAFSMRKLRAAYSGNCIRLRRSSDNSEQDIGFASNGVIDVSAMLSFVGVGNGFVVTWYDQSGNGRNITQSTGSNQPQIVFSGTVALRNNLPCIRYSESTIALTMVTSSAYSVPSAITFNSVFTPLSGLTSYRSLFSIGNSAASSAYTEFIYRTGGTQDDWVLEDAIFVSNGFSAGRNPRLVSNGQRFFNGTQYVTFGTINSTLNILDVNNSVSTTRINNSGLIPSQSGIFRIGNNSGSTQQLAGDIQEFILWGNNLTTDKSGIINNANNYYNVF